MPSRAIAEPSLLVSVGEVSGDLMAADVVRELRGNRRLTVFGMVGPQSRDAGVGSVVDMDRLAVMGIGTVARRALALAGAARRLCRAAEATRPTAALLVGFSEFNARLGAWLRRRGTRVLWYAPPQVWAWRPRRAHSLRVSADHLALILPFEESLWRAAGSQASFVGHPAVERARRSGRSAPATTADRQKVALLPGSRTQEVRRHWPVFLEALARLGRRVAATVIPAEGLDASTTRWVERTAAASGVSVGRGSAATLLPGHGAAVCASGTATVDCIAAGVPPVIVYRTDALTYAVAERLVRVPHIGVPNLVLGRRVFPELVQAELNAAGLERALLATLHRRSVLLDACAEATRRLSPPVGFPSAHVAATLSEWLESS